MYARIVDGRKIARVTDGGSLQVTLSGNIMELYGATADDRPAANSVRVGTYFTEVDSQQVWQSNGTEWIAVHTIMAIDGQLVRRVS